MTEEQKIAFEKFCKEIRDLPDFLMTAEPGEDIPDSIVIAEDDIPF